MLDSNANKKCDNNSDCPRKVHRDSNHSHINNIQSRYNSIATIKIIWQDCKKTCYKRYKFLKYYYLDFTDRDKIFHYASSLSFYNIFSIIPVFLMLFSILASFSSFQDQIQNFKQTILENILPGSTHEISEMLNRFLSNGREMGFLGFLVSLISSFIFFRNFDDISARIFSAKKRSFFDSFIIYWLLITLIPLFFVTSIYFNTVILHKYSEVNMLSKLYAIMPMLATWLIFAILFRIAANKTIRLLVLGFSSFIGAIIWYLLKSWFFYYMSYNQFYSNIYGSVSIVMFVFLWIYVSWLVILISMRLCKKLDDKFPESS